LRVALPYNRRAARTFRDLNVVHSHSPFSLGLVAVAKGTRYRIPHVLTDHRYLPSTGTACREPCALQRRQPKRPPRLPAIAAPP
ncbi:MAG: glycosyltransferase, partial [Candidatus Bipolaricaulota bacterium]|nr:glycosyltransferase [Candidatus Bipolaricaulota bacterium]